MRSKQRATMSRWIPAMLFCVIGVCACDDSDGADTLSIDAGSMRNDSAVVNTRVIYNGFDHTFVDFAKSGGLNIPVRARSGTIVLQFARIKGQADTIGKAVLSLQIKRGNVYTASFTRLFANMSTGCFGCSGEQVLPMLGSASASTDSMHVSYSSGLPLCKGCVAAVRDKAIVVARKD